MALFLERGAGTVLVARAVLNLFVVKHLWYMLARQFPSFAQDGRTLGLLDVVAEIVARFVVVTALRDVLVQGPTVDLLDVVDDGGREFAACQLW